MGIGSALSKMFAPKKKDERIKGTSGNVTEVEFDEQRSNKIDITGRIEENQQEQISYEKFLKEISNEELGRGIINTIIKMKKAGAEINISENEIRNATQNIDLGINEASFIDEKLSDSPDITVRKNGQVLALLNFRDNNSTLMVKYNIDKNAYRSYLELKDDKDYREHIKQKIYDECIKRGANPKEAKNISQARVDEYIKGQAIAANIDQYEANAAALEGTPKERIESNSYGLYHEVRDVDVIHRKNLELPELPKDPFIETMRQQVKKKEQREQEIPENDNAFLKGISNEELGRAIFKTVLGASVTGNGIEISTEQRKETLNNMHNGINSVSYIPEDITTNKDIAISEDGTVTGTIRYKADEKSDIEKAICLQFKIGEDTLKKYNENMQDGEYLDTVCNILYENNRAEYEKAGMTKEKITSIIENEARAYIKAKAIADTITPGSSKCTLTNLSKDEITVKAPEDIRKDDDKYRKAEKLEEIEDLEI